MDEDVSSNASKKDFAWKYTILTLDEKYFKCRFCEHTCSGTINRLKHHLEGTHKGINPCLKVSNDIAEECKKALLKVQNVKTMQSATLEEMRSVEIGSGNIGSKAGSCQISENLLPKARGPIDNFVNTQTRQVTLNSKMEKRRNKRRFVSELVGFSSQVVFHLILQMIHIIFLCLKELLIIPCFVSPSMHELRTWILQDEVTNINKMLDEHKISWKQYGCSIMSERWTDGKSRCFINFLIKSMETPCALHCIDLLLEDIGKLKIHQDTLTKAKAVVRFIYGHICVLDLMRSFTNNHELLRPAVTRFATAYLTLQSIQNQKQGLRSMFSSEAWNKSA
uniref:C2H2-type domain-containing protein n=1 Tax=Solanum lycopersicum TaxID=4081 RepID=K4CJL8_SOLLC